MKVLQCVFSPTGGTQRVVDILAAELGNTVNKIDLTKADINNDTADKEKCDIAVIAVPSYGGRVPALAAQRLATLKGNNMNCVIVCVYGNRAYEDTLVELNDIVLQCGFNVIAAISAVAEHSIIHQYATDRPDTQDAQLLQEFAKKIQGKLKQSEFPAFKIPGNRPYKKAGGAGLVPKANNNCNLCGKCAEECPVQAISKESIKRSDAKKCISCMHCVTNCPQAARQTNKVLVSVAAMAIKSACSVRKECELFI